MYWNWVGEGWILGVQTKITIAEAKRNKPSVKNGACKPILVDINPPRAGPIAKLPIRFIPPIEARTLPRKSFLIVVLAISIRDTIQDARQEPIKNPAIHSMIRLLLIPARIDANIKKVSVLTVIIRLEIFAAINPAGILNKRVPAAISATTTEAPLRSPLNSLASLGRAGRVNPQPILHSSSGRYS